MDKDKAKGSLNQLKGSLKEAVGKVTGNRKVEAEGVADKATGKAQSTAGGLKDKARNIFKR